MLRFHSLGALAALCAPLLAQQITPVSVPPRAGAQTTVTVTPITGTSKTMSAGVSRANLDAGNLVAGQTRWELEGIYWLETWVGFAWSPSTGGIPFEVPASLYFNDHIQSTNDIADTGKVVGAAIFTNQFVGAPFQWTKASGFEFLPVPPGGWNGGATAVSADGTLIAGSLYQGIFGASRAARWESGNVELIGAAGQYSMVYDTSDDGRLLVGEAGPDEDDVHATRWFDGVELGLDPLPGETSSSARHAADFGGRVLGTANVNGRVVLVRWRADGSAQSFAPPSGLSVETVNAIDPKGRFAVGSLTDGLPFYQSDWVPYVWSAREGFTLLDELGYPGEFDKSRAIDVSDDGKIVIGQLSSSVVSSGSPTPTGFLWTPGAGTQPIDRLLKEAGEKPLGIYSTIALSGDGRTILAIANKRPTPNDTSAVLLEFAFGPPLK